MIHLNIGSNLNSIHGSRFDNISIAIQLLIEAKIQIKKISNFYETPSYPNKKLPKFLDNAKLTDIDLLTLDTEGYELEVLKGLNLEKYKPSYMLIEVYKDDHPKVVSYLSQYNYTLISNFSGYNKKDNPQWDGTHQDILFKKNK